MAVWHKPTSIKELNKRAKQIEAAELAASIIFVTLAEKDAMFDNTTLGEHASLFDNWQANTGYTRGQIRLDEGVLYKCSAAHGAERAQTPPSQSPKLWRRVADPSDEWPEWFPYSGAADAWVKGSKCSHKGKHYESLVDFNVWPPDDASAWEPVS